MCGIFGQITNNPKKLDISAVNLLGIYNIERGKQSCGLTWDGEIFHGLDKDKLYSDFIKNRTIKPKHFPVIFGHTRQASAGNVISLENAHPFGYGVSKDGFSYEFIFVHNGTLKNHKELAKKYDIELSVKVTKKCVNSETTYESTREKIDSEILGEILWKTKSYHVLSEYVGAAACAWTWCDEPNKLYLWSGASKIHIDDEDNKIFEERPLCVYNESKNNMFFSSIEESLTAVGGMIKENIEQINVNHVHIITDGDYKNCEKIKTTRSNSAQDNSFKSFQNFQNFGESNYFKDRNYHSSFNNKSNVTVNTWGLDILEDKPLLDVNRYTGKVYSKSLRYWKNGHLINGIYIYVSGYGFKKIGDNYNEAQIEIKRIEDKIFLIDDWSSTLTNGYVPVKKNSNIQLHYFIDGALLRNITDYTKCQNLKKAVPLYVKYIDSVTLSYMTKHPVSTLVNLHKPLVYFDGVVYTGNSVELGFEKIYYFENGKFVKFEKRLDLIEKEKSVIQLPSTFNQKVLECSINSINNIEKNNEKELIDSIVYQEFEFNKNQNEEDSFVSEYITESFNEIIETSKDLISNLEEYKKETIVEEAIRILKLAKHALNDFIMTPKNSKNE